jgi:hypothetical protein
VVFLNLSPIFPPRFRHGGKIESHNDGVG